MRTLTPLACLLFMACQSQHQEPPVQEKSSTEEMAKQLAETIISYWDCGFSKVYGFEGGRMEIDAFVEEMATCIEATGTGMDADFIRGTIGPTMYVCFNHGTLEEYYESKGIDPNTVPEATKFMVQMLIETSKTTDSDRDMIIASLSEEQIQEITPIIAAMVEDIKAWYESHDEEYWQEVRRKFPAPKPDSVPADGKEKD